VAQFAGSHLTLPKVTIRHGRGEESAPVEESRDNREHPKEQRITTTTKTTAAAACDSCTSDAPKI